MRINQTSWKDYAVYLTVKLLLVLASTVILGLFDGSESPQTTDLLFIFQLKLVYMASTFRGCKMEATAAVVPIAFLIGISVFRD
jgi:hypothetical protein